MIFFVIIGVIAAVFGVLFIFAPGILIYLSEISNKIFMTDEVAIKFRMWVGVALLLVSVLMFVVAVYLTSV
ncbi:hypothetical protein ACFL01_01955 [Planctomycetota bacterium]